VLSQRLRSQFSIWGNQYKEGNSIEKLARRKEAPKVAAFTLPRLRLRDLLAHLVQLRPQTLHYQKQIRHAEWDFVGSP
jgi:hypothetical protein